MKIVFMGTPDFAVPSLIAINNCDRLSLTGVVTRPDRKRGRGQKLKPTPVKQKARALDLSVYQPGDVNEPAFLQKLTRLNPDVIAVVAFGQKLGRPLLELPEYGCINLHASLLPRYRGAAPIHRAIINGDEKTGITTIYMDEELDTGDIIYKEELAIKFTDTVGELHDKLARRGGELLVKTLLDVGKGTAPRKTQDEDRATYAPKLDKETGKIDWTAGAREIYNLVRGVNPWPGAYTHLKDKLLKVQEVEIYSEEKKEGRPGEVLAASEEKGLIVQTGRGQLRLKKLQLAGRKRMSARKFLRGHDLDRGWKLG